MLRQQFLVDPRLVIKSFQITCCNQLQQVLIARFVLGKENEVVGSIPQFMFILLLKATFGSDVNFAANNRFQAVFLRPAVEINRAKQVAVIGHSYGGHFIFHRTLEQRIVP